MAPLSVSPHWRHTPRPTPGTRFLWKQIMDFITDDRRDGLVLRIHWASFTNRVNCGTGWGIQNVCSPPINGWCHGDYVHLRYTVWVNKKCIDINLKLCVSISFLFGCLPSNCRQSDVWLLSCWSRRPCLPSFFCSFFLFLASFFLSFLGMDLNVKPFLFLSDPQPLSQGENIQLLVITAPLSLHRKHFCASSTWNTNVSVLHFWNLIDLCFSRHASHWEYHLSTQDKFP